MLIATIVISVVFHCRRSNPRDNNRDGMPADGNDSKRARYELKSEDSKDKNSRFVEEKGINNEGMEETAHWYLHSPLAKIRFNVYFLVTVAFVEIY